MPRRRFGADRGRWMGDLPAWERRLGLTGYTEAEMTRMAVTAVIAFATLSGPASGQLINGDFELGSLNPWAVTPTPAGLSLMTGVTSYDIDGPGPLTTSNTARVLVGRTGPSVAGWEGVTLSQAVSLIGGRHYRFRANWAVRPVVNLYNESGGRFELIVAGEALVAATAPSTAGLAPSYGTLEATFKPETSGVVVLGLRITRTVPAGEEVLQYADNIRVDSCYPDCDGTGQLTVADFACFQTRFVTGAPYADCTGEGLLTVADFACFQTRFVTGCP